MNKYQILELARTYPTEVTLIKFSPEHFKDFVSIVTLLPCQLRLPTSPAPYILRIGNAAYFSRPFGFSSEGYVSVSTPPIPYTPSPPTIFTRNPHAKEVLHTDGILL